MISIIISIVSLISLIVFSVWALSYLAYYERIFAALGQEGKKTFKELEEKLDNMQKSIDEKFKETEKHHLDEYHYNPLNDVLDIDNIDQSYREAHDEEEKENQERENKK